MDNTFNLIQVIRIILKWKWYIISAIALSAVISVIVALFVLPVYFKSSSTFYPVNQSITDRNNIFAEKSDIVDYYGTKKDAQRILEIAISSPVVDFMINWYNLAEHYGIDTTSSPYWRTKAKKEFMDNYEIIKTKNDAISVTIYDKDPALAAEMVNMLISKIDEHNKKPVINTKFKMRDVFKNSVAEKTVELASLTDSLGIMAEQYSIKVHVNEEGANIISGPNAGGVEKYKVMQQRHEAALEAFKEAKMLYGQYDVSTKENVASLYVLEEAFPADKKSKPVRWLVCATTVVVTAFLAILLAILFEQIQAIKEEL